MAEVFHRTRVVQAWLAGIRYLESQKTLDATNVILTIDSPMLAAQEDKSVVEAVNYALKKKNPSRSVMTAAGTIFPQQIYRRYGRPGWYDRYKSIMSRGKERGSWGTYALRMIERNDAEGEAFNPLETIVTKLAALRERELSKYKAAYELGVNDPLLDLTNPRNGIGFELPTYNPAVDRNMYIGSPCLSHVTFKLIDDRLDMTAIYRSHYYAERALGNLIGLAQLQHYVAVESGFEVGTLTCISTYAKLDGGLGGVGATRALLTSFPPDETLKVT
jgi:hypothetical protein